MLSEAQSFTRRAAGPLNCALSQPPALTCHTFPFLRFTQCPLGNVEQSAMETSLVHLAFSPHLFPSQAVLAAPVPKVEMYVSNLDGRG